MDRHQPWLADFINTSVSEWLHKQHSSLEYHFRKVDINLQVRPKIDGARVVRLIELSAEDRGRVSDGAHNIEATFPPAVATAVQSRVQRSQLAQSEVLLQVGDPCIGIEACLDPPQPRLRSKSWAILESANHGARSLPAGVRVTDDEEIKRTMLDYTGVQEQTRDFSGTGGSPLSIRSQPDHIFDANGGAMELVEDASQQFFTQVAFEAESWQLQHTGHQSERSQRVAADAHPANNLFEALQNARAAGKTSESRVAQSSSSLILEAPLAPPSKAPPEPHNGGMEQSPERSRKTLPNSLLAKGLSPPSRNLYQKTSANVTTTSVENRSIQKDPSLLVANAPSPKAGTERSIGEGQPRASPETTSKQQKTSRPHPPPPSRNFERWRREAFAGKYVPRYAQTISRAQVELLESDSSWQPPLVGHPQRPGQIPLSLLEQFSNAVDNPINPAPSPSESPESSPERPQISIMATRQPDEPLPGNQEAENSSDSDSPVEWSPSPQSQRRRNILPPNSPLLDLRQRLQLSRINKAGNETANEQNSFPVVPAGESEDAKIAVQTLRGRGSVTMSPGQHTLVQGGDTDSTTGAGDILILPSPLESAEALQGPPESQNPSTTYVPPTASNSRSIQVQRTPFPGKGPQSTNSGALTVARRNLMASPGTGDLMSSYVPSSYPTIGEAGNNMTEPMALNSSHLGSLESGNINIERRRPPTPEAETGSAQEVNSNSGSYALQGEHTAITSSVSQVLAPQPASAHCAPHAPINTDKPSTVITQPPESGPKNSEDVQKHESRLNSESRRQGARESGTDSAESLAKKSQKPTVLSSSENAGISARTKRKRTESLTSSSPRKRQQMNPDAIHIDPDYLETMVRMREERRSTLRPLSKPKPTQPQVALPSVEDADNSSDVAQQTPKDRDASESADGSARKSDTPLTHASMCSCGGNASDKPEMRGTAIAGSPHIGSANHDLFTTYQMAYPDYKGDKRQFVVSCTLIGNTLRQVPMALHPFLLDDAIFHHFHSYLEGYWKFEGLLAPEPLPFHEFYTQNIQVPNHLAHIVTNAAIQTFANCQASRESSVGEDRMYTGNGAAASFGAGVRPPAPGHRLATPENRLSLEDAVAERELNKDLVVEQWRQTATGPPSPELGTPNIDRSISAETVALDIPAPAGEASLSRTSKASIAQTEALRSRRSAAPGLTESKETSKPKKKRRSRPSASPFVKPTRPVQKAETVKTSASSSPTGGQSESQATEQGTPFTMFAKRYSALLGDRKRRPVMSTGNVVTTDVFSWRV